MPRLARTRTGVFDDLADQLRFTPRATLLRQITRAERLASEIDPEQTYPEDWLVHRITGYRPEIESPALLVGRAILADLSPFVELLCERAELTPADLPESGTQSLGVDDLCHRWGVERRTIDRFRRRGLVARRIRTPQGATAGGTRLVFMPDPVRAFEARHADRLRRSGAFSRLTDAERAMIARRIPRYRARLGWSRSHAVARLAARMGRSPGAVERAARVHDPGAEPREPVDTHAVFEAWRDGAPIGALVARTGRTRAAVHHLIHTRRVALLRSLDLAPPAGEPSERALESPHARSGLALPAWAEAREFVEAARAAPPTAREAESARARAMAYLRFRAGAMIAGLPEDRRAPAPALDRIETDLRWITRLAAALVHAESALILKSIEERAGAPLLDLAPADATHWFETAFDAASAATLRFDPARGGRLAAPVTIALSHALAPLRVSPVDPARARPVIRLPDWRQRLASWQAWLEPGERARSIIVQTNDRAAVLAARYGLDGGPPRTTEEIEREFGVSASGLARIERG